MQFFSERLRGVRLRKGQSQAEFAKTIGVSLRMLSGYEGGQNKPPPAKLRSICEKLRVPIAYFTEDLAVREPSLEPRETPVTPRNHGGPYWGTTCEAPVVSWAQAGAEWHSYQDLTSQIDERIPTDCKDTNCFWVQIEGDSMEPRFVSGDYVIVMPNVEPQNGDLVIAKMVDGGVYFKLFHRLGNGERIRLTSYNRELYLPMEFPAEQFLRVFPVYGIFRRVKAGGKRNCAA